MKLTDMRDILKAYDLRLTRSLGQSFLHDGNQLRRIVAAAELTKADRVLEIGPGLGPLTELLVQHAGQVLAIEKDARLAELLRARFDSECKIQNSQFEVLHADALELLRRERREWSNWKLVANLPYSVASPILVELAQSAERPERMVVTLQLEVAKRLMAAPGCKDFGVLTLLVQLDYEPRGWFKIPASCFFPEPKVDSACVVLVRRKPPLLPEEQHVAFAKIVKRAFSQRRKMMAKLLSLDWPEEILARALDETNLSSQSRGEMVSLEQFVHIASSLAR